MPAESIHSSESIKWVREQFTNDANSNESEYEKVDVDRVLSNDWTVERFIIDRKGDLEAALEMLKETMKWRKREGVNHIKATDFPVEFWQIGELYVYQKDKEGTVTCYLRASFHKKLADWMEIQKQYVLFFFETAEKEANGKWNFVWDCSEAGLSNMNMELVSFFVSTVTRYYPGSFKNIYVYEMPIVLWAIYQIIQGLFPAEYREVIGFVSKTNIKETIGEAHLPDYLGGNCPKKYRGRIAGALSLTDFAVKKGLKEGAVKRLLAHYQKYINQCP